MSVIGTAWHPGHLEDKVIETLKLWLPSSLNEAIAQDSNAPAKVAVPRSYIVVSEDDRWPEDQLPAIVVTSPGLVDTPDRDKGDGSWRGTWSLEVTAIVKGRTAPEARRVCQLYWTAICISVLQRRSLGKPYQASTLADAALDSVPIEKRRTLAGATALFHVEVQSMFSEYDGPKTPVPPDPMPATWPVVTETNTETEIT